MSAFSELKTRFSSILEEFHKSWPIQRLVNGELTVNEYRSVTRQLFHHTRENPQLQAYATVHFRGRQRDMVDTFLKHANSEVGHDQLALNDFATLGGDPTNVPYENPLPATTALLSFGFYQVSNLNPLGYLGYVYFLEFMPTSSGELLMTSLSKVGVPDNAMTFLRDHAEIDVSHNRLMERYAGGMLTSEKHIDAVEYAMKTTGHLYAQMLAQSVETAEIDARTGWNWSELDADGVSPEQRRAVEVA